MVIVAAGREIQSIFKVKGIFFGNENLGAILTKGFQIAQWQRIHLPVQKM